MADIIIISVILAIIMVAANLALEEKTLARVVVVAVVLINLIIVALGISYVGLANVPSEQLDANNLPNVTEENAINSLIINIIVAIIGLSLLFLPVRKALANFFPKRTAKSNKTTLDGTLLPSNPNAPAFRGYDPNNIIHTLGLMFAVWLVGSQLSVFVLQGGLEGIAQDIEVTYASLAANFFPQVIIPMIGVGLFLRRTWTETKERLGLTAPRHPMMSDTMSPHVEAIVVGLASGIGMIFIVSIMAGIWALIVSPETMESQQAASEALANSIDTLMLGFFVAFTAAIGEEIAFRGALQPIFGFWATAIIFVVTHIQYTATFAALIIFVVAIVLGWLRERYNLYAAIAAHFIYNFTLILLQFAVS